MEWILPVRVVNIFLFPSTFETELQNVAYRSTFFLGTLYLQSLLFKPVIYNLTKCVPIVVAVFQELDMWSVRRNNDVRITNEEQLEP